MIIICTKGGKNVITSVNTRVQNPKHVDSGTLRLLLAPVDGAVSFNGQPTSTHYSITHTRAFISCIVDKV